MNYQEQGEILKITITKLREDMIRHYIYGDLPVKYWEGEVFAEFFSYITTVTPYYIKETK